MSNVVDIEALRGEAFNFLNRFPEYSRQVLDVIEELEKARDQVFTLRLLREDDDKIIRGLVDYFKLADDLCVAIDKYAADTGDEVEVFKALQAWKQSGKEIKV